MPCILLFVLTSDMYHWTLVISDMCYFTIADDGAKIRLQHYIAARQQNSFGHSSEACATTLTGGSSTAHQLQIQPLCLNGSPTASSSPGIASSGNPSAPAGYTSSPSNLSGAAMHARFFLPGFKAGQFQAAPGQDGAGQFHAAPGQGGAGQFQAAPWQDGTGHFPAGPRFESTGQLQTALRQPGIALETTQLSKLSSMQAGLPPDVAQLLEGAAAARARLEPNRCLTDKENSACFALGGMSMRRREDSRLMETTSASQHSHAAERHVETSQGHAELYANMAPPSVGSNRVKMMADLERVHSGKTDSEGNQGRSAARRMKLHAMLENL